MRQAVQASVVAVGLAAFLAAPAASRPAAPKFVYALTKIAFITEFKAQGPVSIGGKPARVNVNVRLVFLYGGARAGTITISSGAGISCAAGLNCRNFKPPLGGWTIKGTVKYDDGSPPVACSLKPLLDAPRFKDKRIAVLQLRFQNQAGTRVAPNYFFNIDAESYIGTDTLRGPCAVLADPAIHTFSKTQTSGFKPTITTLGPKTITLTQGADYETKNPTADVLRGSYSGKWIGTLTRVS